MTNLLPTLRSSEHFRVNADREARRPMPRADSCDLACAFVPACAMTCQTLAGRSLRICSGPALELVRHPLGLAAPDRAATWGQPSTQQPAEFPKLCPRVAVW
jgi:hypothetical protein